MQYVRSKVSLRTYAGIGCTTAWPRTCLSSLSSVPSLTPPTSSRKPSQFIAAMILPPYLFPILPAPLTDNYHPTLCLYYSLALLSPLGLFVPPLLLQPRRSHMFPTFHLHGCRRRYIVRPSAFLPALISSFSSGAGVLMHSIIPYS